MSDFAMSQEYQAMAKSCRDYDCLIARLCWYIDDLHVKLERIEKHNEFLLSELRKETDRRKQLEEEKGRTK